MSLKSNIEQRLQELGSDPKRSLGQNFLISRSKIELIVNRVRALPAGFRLIELGPGLGSLTEDLLAIDPQIRLIELDQKFAAYWRSRGMTVVEEDGLRTDWSQLVSDGFKSILISNLPYQISASLVIDRCAGPQNLIEMVLMFQKEVAQRITAPIDTKAYGLLSVMAQTYFEIVKVADLGPKDFYPAPKVASRVLHFKRKDESVPAEEFLKFCKQAFSQRRKLLLKNLLPGVSNRGQKKEDLEKAFETQGVSPLARAENLTPAQFKSLFLSLSRF